MAKGLCVGDLQNSFVNRSIDRDSVSTRLVGAVTAENWTFPTGHQHRNCLQLSNGAIQLSFPLILVDDGEAVLRAPA